MMKSSEPLKRRKIEILDIYIDDISFEDAVLAILKMSKNKDSNIVATINSEFVMLARRNKKFAKILKNADLAIADGKWVAISKLIMGGKVHDRIAGVDLVEKLCQMSANRPIRIGFIGGFDSVAVEASKRQQIAYPGLNVVYADSGDPAMGSDPRLIRQLSKAGRIDILFVAYGMGRQEFWIKRNQKKLNVGVFIGVGGALDYLAQAKKRAPKFMQNFGLEWLWRLINEPNRVWRMRVLPIFAILVLFRYFRHFFKIL